jgi:hypothetical protein
MLHRFRKVEVVVSFHSNSEFYYSESYYLKPSEVAGLPRLVGGLLTAARKRRELETFLPEFDRNV